MFKHINLRVKVLSVILVLAILAFIGVLVRPQASGTTAQTLVPSTVTDAYITNGTGISMVNMKTNAVVQLAGSSYNFSNDTDIATWQGSDHNYYGYVTSTANNGSGQVTVINLSGLGQNPLFVNNITGFTGTPRAIAIDGNYAYVVSQPSDTTYGKLVRVNLLLNKIVAGSQSDVCSQPNGISIDSSSAIKYAYITCSSTRGVYKYSLINIAANARGEQIPGTSTSLFTGVATNGAATYVVSLGQLYKIAPPNYTIDINQPIVFRSVTSKGPVATASAYLRGHIAFNNNTLYGGLLNGNGLSNGGGLGQFDVNVTPAVFKQEVASTTPGVILNYLGGIAFAPAPSTIVGTTGGSGTISVGANCSPTLTLQNMNTSNKVIAGDLINPARYRLVVLPAGGCSTTQTLYLDKLTLTSGVNTINVPLQTINGLNNPFSLNKSAISSELTFPVAANSVGGVYSATLNISTTPAYILGSGFNASSNNYLSIVTALCPATPTVTISNMNQTSVVPGSSTYAVFNVIISPLPAGCPARSLTMQSPALVGQDGTPAAPIAINNAMLVTNPILLGNTTLNPVPHVQFLVPYGTPTGHYHLSLGIKPAGSGAAVGYWSDVSKPLLVSANTAGATTYPVCNVLPALTNSNITSHTTNTNGSVQSNGTLQFSLTNNSSKCTATWTVGSITTLTPWAPTSFNPANLTGNQVVAVTVDSNLAVQSNGFAHFTLAPGKTAKVGIILAADANWNNKNLLVPGKSYYQWIIVSNTGMLSLGTGSGGWNSSKEVGFASAPFVR